MALGLVRDRKIPTVGWDRRVIEACPDFVRQSVANERNFFRTRNVPFRGAASYGAPEKRAHALRRNHSSETDQALVVQHGGAPRMPRHVTFVKPLRRQLGIRSINTNPAAKPCARFNRVYRLSIHDPKPLAEQSMVPCQLRRVARPLDVIEQRVPALGDAFGLGFQRLHKAARLPTQLKRMLILRDDTRDRVPYTRDDPNNPYVLAIGKTRDVSGGDVAPKMIGRRLDPYTCVRVACVFLLEFVSGFRSSQGKICTRAAPDPGREVRKVLGFLVLRRCNTGQTPKPGGQGRRPAFWSADKHHITFRGQCSTLDLQIVPASIRSGNLPVPTKPLTAWRVKKVDNELPARCAGQEFFDLEMYA